MRYLLDTCALLRWLKGDFRISGQVIDEINSPGNEVYVSSASIWEIRIKQQIGKLSVDENFSEVIASCGFQSLPITFFHANKIVDLPMIHRDPFLQSTDCPMPC
ncbi:type II toxin-antitoxin system VapC family toxin [Endozoicomonas sp. 2B-B]